MIISNIMLKIPYYVSIVITHALHNIIAVKFMLWFVIALNFTPFASISKKRQNNYRVTGISKSLISDRSNMTLNITPRAHKAFQRYPQQCSACIIMKQRKMHDLVYTEIN